jgi:hypothetical protein
MEEGSELLTEKEKNMDKLAYHRSIAVLFMSYLFLISIVAALSTIQTYMCRNTSNGYVSGIFGGAFFALCFTIMYATERRGVLCLVWGCLVIGLAVTVGAVVGQTSEWEEVPYLDKLYSVCKHPQPPKDLLDSNFTCVEASIWDNSSQPLKQLIQTRGARSPWVMFLNLTDTTDEYMYLRPLPWALN